MRPVAGFSVADQVTFVHGDACGYVSHEPVDLAACVGATWIGGGVAGTVELLVSSLRPGGPMLIGEPYWRREVPDQQTANACLAADKDELAVGVRAELTTGPARYTRYQREYLGWGVFALMGR